MTRLLSGAATVCLARSSPTEQGLAGGITALEIFAGASRSSEQLFKKKGKKEKERQEGDSDMEQGQN